MTISMSGSPRAEGGGSFTVTRDVSGEPLDRGTKITLFLKEDEIQIIRSDAIIINNEHPRDGPGRAGERELPLHHRRLRGPLPDHAGPAQPGRQVRVRRGSRHRAQALGVRGRLLQLLLVLQPRRAGSQARDQPPQQQGRRRCLPRPHQRQGLAVRDARVRDRVRHGMRVLGAVDGERRADQVGCCVLRERVRGQGRGRARHARFFRAGCLYFYCFLCFHALMYSFIRGCDLWVFWFVD
ncbi:Heat shock protein 90-1 [Acorus calamus]|uniref:Heat shock protein 90-1 n=1 Tax=Acorus calamus TaxID=4465 RepID=A0AAV9DR26_ACOCL|nr:Heat shock protein 90-1 [Acorus calamus]